MSIHYLFVINRAGSLIYDWEGRSGGDVHVEKTFSYPLDIRLENVDQRVVVVFGERDGVRIGHHVLAVNGLAVTGGRFSIDDVQHSVIEYLDDESHYPVSLKFGRVSLSSNEKIILSSTFHAMYAMGAQLSPCTNSSGILVLHTANFRLQCYQASTGIKLIVVAEKTAQGLDALLRRLYELYADFALKNPFYSMDMPIRCERFDNSLKSLVEKYDKFPLVTV